MNTSGGSQMQACGYPGELDGRNDFGEDQGKMRQRVMAEAQADEAQGDGPVDEAVPAPKQAAQQDLVGRVHLLRQELAVWHASAGGQAAVHASQLARLQGDLQQEMGRLKEHVRCMQRSVKAALAANGEAPQGGARSAAASGDAAYPQRVNESPPPRAGSRPYIHSDSLAYQANAF